MTDKAKSTGMHLLHGSGLLFSEIYPGSISEQSGFLDRIEFGHEVLMDDCSFSFQDYSANGVYLYRIT